MSVADFAHAANGLLAFQAVNGGLDGGIGGPVAFRECLLDFADGARAAIPQGLHDLELEFAEFRQGHLSTNLVCESTTGVCFAQEDFFCEDWRLYFSICCRSCSG